MYSSFLSSAHFASAMFSQSVSNDVKIQFFNFEFFGFLRAENLNFPIRKF